MRGSRDEELSELADRLDAFGAADDEARPAAFDSVCDALARAASRATRLPVFDDLHWCDVPSVKLLCFVARSLRDARLMILMTWRDTDLHARPELARALHRLNRDCQRHQLGGLEEAAIAEYLEACGHGSISPAVMHQGTAGNPFFLGELIAVAASAGHKSCVARDHQGGDHRTPGPFVRARQGGSRRLGAPPSRSSR